MTAEEIQKMTDEEVNEEELVGLRALNTLFEALPQRKRLELISLMHNRALKYINNDPSAYARLLQIGLERRFVHILA